MIYEPVLQQDEPLTPIPASPVKPPEFSWGYAEFFPDDRHIEITHNATGMILWRFHVDDCGIRAADELSNLMGQIRQEIDSYRPICCKK